MMDKLKAAFDKRNWGVPPAIVSASIVSALLLLLYRFFCAGATFYDRFIAPIFDIDGGAFFGFASHAWKGVSTFALLGVVALLASLFLDRTTPKEMGIRLGDWRKGLKWTAVFVAIMIPVVVVAGFFPTFQNKYPLAQTASDSVPAFLVFESVMLLYFIGWEFFFRGYMLFSFHKHVGNLAVFIQMIPFALLHGSKPLPEALGAIIVGILLGYFALHTRSFLYCALAHFLVALSMDLSATIQKLQII